MKFYFSGVSNVTTRDILVQAGVTSFLADPTDFPVLPTDPHNSLALDSGAYRAWKQGREVDTEEYLQFLYTIQRPLDFCVTPDVIGDADASFRRWAALWHQGIETLPVWHYEADPAYLHHYLSRSQLVGIGGLVTPMREKNEDVLKTIVALCQQYPGRFHLFGLNWLKAMVEVKETSSSIDTSKFLDAARYGHIIFVNSKTGRLSQCPAKAIPELSTLTRHERLVLSARNLKNYFEDIPQNGPFGLPTNYA